MLIATRLATPTLALATSISHTHTQRALPARGASLDAASAAASVAFLRRHLRLRPPDRPATAAASGRRVVGRRGRAARRRRGAARRHPGAAEAARDAGADAPVGAHDARSCVRRPCESCRVIEGHERVHAAEEGLKILSASLMSIVGLAGWRRRPWSGGNAPNGPVRRRATASARARVRPIDLGVPGRRKRVDREGLAWRADATAVDAHHRWRRGLPAVAQFGVVGAASAGPRARRHAAASALNFSGSPPLSGWNFSASLRNAALISNSVARCDTSSTS